MLFVEEARQHFRCFFGALGDEACLLEAFWDGAPEFLYMRPVSFFGGHLSALCAGDVVFDGLLQLGESIASSNLARSPLVSLLLPSTSGGVHRIGRVGSKNGFTSESDCLERCLSVETCLGKLCL